MPPYARKTGNAVDMNGTKAAHPWTHIMRTDLMNVQPYPHALTGLLNDDHT